jgi:hypothetical protein
MTRHRVFVLVLMVLEAGQVLVAQEATTPKLRVAFGDNRSMPTQLLTAGDLVCSPDDLGLGSNNPQMRISKFMAATKMTPEELARRKQQGFNWVCYDNENGEDWPTPKAELTDPTKYTLMAAKAAHAAGLKFIAEPNFELIVGRGSRGKNGKLELTEKQVPYVRLKEVAPDLDAISLQLQRAQADLAQYRELTRRYAGEVRSVNPNAIIFVQVTFREKSGKVSTPADLLRAVQAVADLVDGIWIHNDRNNEEHLRSATELVRLMAEAGYRQAGISKP